MLAVNSVSLRIPPFEARVTGDFMFRRSLNLS